MNTAPARLTPFQNGSRLPMTTTGFFASSSAMAHECTPVALRSRGASSGCTGGCNLVIGRLERGVELLIRARRGRVELLGLQLDLADRRVKRRVVCRS